MEKDDYQANEDKESESKSKNITIRVTPELRTLAYGLWQRHFGELAFNQFLAHMVKLGIQESEIRLQESSKRNTGRVSAGHNLNERVI